MSDLLCAKNDQSTTIKKFKELLNSLSSKELLKLSKQTKVIKKTTPTLSFQEEYKKVVIKCMNSKRSKNLIHHTLAEQMRNSKTK